MIGSFAVEDLLILVVLWFITSMVANLLWTRFVVLRYVGRAVMAWIDGINEDEEAKTVLNKLFLLMFSWMGNAQIKTGNKIKVATDQIDADKKPIYKEIEEILTPVDMLARVIGNYAMMKIKGSAGGTKTQLGRILQEEAAEAGGMSPAALKALSQGKLGPALMEIAMPHLRKRLDNTVANMGSSGGEQKWR